MEVLSKASIEKHRTLLVVIVITTGLILNVLNVFLPVKLMLFSILGVFLIGLALLNPFIALLFIILVRIVEVPLPAVSFGFGEVGINKVLGWILVTILFIEGIIKKNLSFLRPLQTKLTFFFVLIALLSSMFALDHTTALSSTLIYSTGFFIYLLLITFVKSEKQVSALIWILVISGILRISMEVLAMQGFIPYLAVPAIGQEFRFGWFYTNPNNLAVHLTLLLPLLVYSLARYKKPFLRISIIFLLVAYTATILLTGSRAGFVSLVLTIFLLFLFRWRNFFRVRNVFAGLIVLLLFVVLIPLVAEEQVTRLTTLRTLHEGGSSQSPTIAIRFHLLRIAFDAFLDNPWLGVGPGNYKFLTPKYGIRPLIAHSTYAEILAETGILGFSVYALLYLVSVLDLNTARKGFRGVDLRMQNMAESLLISFLVLTIMTVQSSRTLHTIPIVFIGLAVVLKNMYSRNTKAEILRK